MHNTFFTSTKDENSAQRKSLDNPFIFDKFLATAGRGRAEIFLPYIFSGDIYGRKKRELAGHVLRLLERL
jgi:hypothetical protein